MRPTVALYARVSTAQQEKQGTIESQIAAVEAYAAAHGVVISSEHRYTDDGYSGARLDRPALERLRDAAWRGELDRVLILSPDRLARHYAYQYVVVEELERAGCRVVFVTGPFTTTPEERLVREVHGLFAEFERAALQERSRRGKLHAAPSSPVSAPTATPTCPRATGTAAAAWSTRPRRSWSARCSPGWSRSSSRPPPSPNG